MSANYSYVFSLVENMQIDEIKSIEKPENLGLFRKNLTEIGQRYHKKFVTKTKGDKLYIMRIKYFSVNEKISIN